MSYKFTSPGRTDAPGASWQTLTLSLPADTPLAIPPDRWERRDGDGRIVATYTRDELKLAVGLALEQKRAELEARLEQGLEVLAAATGCDDEAKRLIEHWDTLIVEYDRIVGRMEAAIWVRYDECKILLEQEWLRRWRTG